MDIPVYSSDLDSLNVISLKETLKIRVMRIDARASHRGAVAKTSALTAVAANRHLDRRARHSAPTCNSTHAAIAV